MNVTLTSPGRATRSAPVTLTQTVSGTTPGWSASTTVLQSGCRIRHATKIHPDERVALVELAEWLRATFWGGTPCLGSTVTIVGVSRSQHPAA